MKRGEEETHNKQKNNIEHATALASVILSRLYAHAIAVIEDLDRSNDRSVVVVSTS